MNIYKNLMFLHGHFVDPREAENELKAEAAQVGRQAEAPVRASRPVSNRTQGSAARATDSWRTWFRLWPRETAKVEVDCDARGCV